MKYTTLLLLLIVGCTVTPTPPAAPEKWPSAACKERWANNPLISKETKSDGTVVSRYRNYNEIKTPKDGMYWEYDAGYTLACTQSR